MHLLLVGILCVVSINAVKWETIDNALNEAKSSGKPILFLMTKSSCKPCKKLNDEMESSKEFEELSQSFTLARATDAEIPDDEKYRFDASYVPKILFISHHGDVHKDIVNVDAKSDKAKFFYSKVEHLLKSMNMCLENSNLDHGFGKDYRWYSWENGQSAAIEQNKPIMLLFHQDWCGACARLKPKFESSPEIKELADKFIFINTDNADLVKGEKYKSDGEYYPKILFLDPHADILDEEWNHGTKHHHVKHYYGDGKEIRLSMDRVLANSTDIEAVDDKGFGKHIKWVKYQKGLALAAAKKKPMMLIIHKSYCGACKALKPRIRNNKEIGELSKQFVMVHCEDDDEPQDDQFDIDGAYIPRIFFLDGSGRVEPSIRSNEQDFKDVRYAYGSAAALLTSMKQALEMDLGNRDSTTQQQQAKTETQTTQTETAKVQETPKVEEEPEDPGFPKLRFGPQIRWFNYEDGLVEAKKSHKASMLVFYNDYCQFSTFLIKQLHESTDVVELAKKFVMIKISEEELSEIQNKERFDIDGTYTPRIIFMDPDQNIYSDVNNTDTAYPQTMFYYGDATKMHDAMSLALKKINLTLGNGFGEYIEWVRFEKSFEVANETGKPIMLIIHKTWCGACSALKPIVHFSRPIWEISMHFVMVNVEDSDEPIDNQYFVDGGYYPRIYFINPNGKVDKSLHNRDPNYLKHKYSYGNEEHILMTMRFAAHKYRNKNVQQESAQTTTTTQTQETTTQQTTTTTTTTTTENSNLTPGKQLLASSGANWISIYDATEKAKQERKPVMFLVHRTTCPSCKALLKSISRDSEFKTKTEGFILADIEDDVDEKKADSYDVDGGYVPRVYFLDPEGEIIESIWNIGTNYITSKFYYYDMTSLYRGMEKAKKHMETWAPGQNKKPDNIKTEL